MRQMCVCMSVQKACGQQGSDVLSPVQHSTVVLRPTAAFTLQFSKYLSEKVRVCVDAQHLGAGGVDDGEAAVPEGLLTRLNQEGLERVRDLVAHVGVGQVEAGEQDGLQLVLRRHQVAVHDVSAQHVDEDHVGRCDEGLVLPALQQQRAINGPQPEHRVGRRQMLQTVAATAQELPEAAKELAGGRLDDDSLRGRRHRPLGDFLHRGKLLGLAVATSVPLAQPQAITEP